METYRYIYRRDGALIFTSERMTEELAELMTRSGLAIAARTDPGVTAVHRAVAGPHRPHSVPGRLHR